MATELLAIAIGLYSLAVGVGIMLDESKIESLMDGLRAQPALTYITGVFVYFLGALLLIVHLRWDGWLEVIVTLVGLGAVIEGIAMFVAPNAFLRFGQRLVQAASSRVWGIVSVLLGLILMIGGIARFGAS